MLNYKVGNLVIFVPSGLVNVCTTTQLMCALSEWQGLGLFELMFGQKMTQNSCCVVSSIVYLWRRVLNSREVECLAIEAKGVAFV